VEAGPYALIVAQLGSSRHTVTDSNLARLAFPTFTVNKECGTRAIENCDPEAGLCPEALYVRLPKIENGVAVEGSTSYIEKEDEPGYIQVHGTLQSCPWRSNASRLLHYKCCLPHVSFAFFALASLCLLKCFLCFG
jgi:hypothetical protein